MMALRPDLSRDEYSTLTIMILLRKGEGMRAREGEEPGSQGGGPGRESQGAGAAGAASRSSHVLLVI